MNRKILFSSLLFATVAQTAATSPTQAKGNGLAPESMRAELAQDIVDRWQPHVSRTYGKNSDGWSERMRSTLRSADLANLELAASADSFRAMNAALLGGAKAFADSGDAPSSLGQPGEDLVYTPVAPCRLVDTRIIGGPIVANTTRSFVAHSAGGFASQGGDASDCALPENVSSVTVKITSVRPDADGYFTAYPYNTVRPLASSLNYTAGMILSDESHVTLCRPGCANELSVYSFATSDLVIDVTGYFTEPEATALDCTVATDSGNLALLSGLQPRSVSCPAGYTATGGGCGGPLGIGVSNSQPVVTAGQPTGWRCDLVGSLLSVISYQVNATCCRVPGR
ncbi:hypothetical protein [Arenimonas sp. MALMAid1274]|uniref:hypothetical protein n=1 Tax=Arenimonas sp. MALMAid1274 TaxID=3411630 RepID=UPI003B9F8BFB